MPGFKTFFNRIAAGTLAGFAGVATVRRMTDKIHGNDNFSRYTDEQRQKHQVFGMHPPLLPTDKQRSVFKEHFPELSHLIPSSWEALRSQQALKTPVHIRPLEECPEKCDFENSGVLSIGGPPALFSAATKAEAGNKVTYLDDKRRAPTYYNSAFHLEHDVPSESPTSYWPATFLVNQLLRAVYDYPSYESIEATGKFPWRTLDWRSWLQHPEQWPTGFRVAFAFQLATMANSQQRQAVNEEVAKQCKAGYEFYNRLNEKLGGKLLLPKRGSVIIARDENEGSELMAMGQDLLKENRELKNLSNEEITKRVGPPQKGYKYAEKTHDMGLSPQFPFLVSEYIRKLGGQVINGTLTTVYTDDKQKGGIAEYRNEKGQKVFIPFSEIILSLGGQPIFGHNNKPLYDLVFARGTAMIALVYAPLDYELPQATVCGGTNHMMIISDKPVKTFDKDGKPCLLHVARLTSGACITPAVSEENSADYDSTIALGLYNAVSKSLPGCTFEIVETLGCNRPVSKNGQSRWFSPYPHMKVQFGPGGGGLTRAFDLFTQPADEPEETSSSQMRM